MAFDWIDEFLSITETIRSPESFRLWAAISTIAAVTERRTGMATDAPNPLHPNQYIVLAGNPASGKSLMTSFVKQILSELASERGGIFLGPDNPTKASFLQQFEKSTKMSLNGSGMALHSSMYVVCSELGVLISRYEKDFIADLTHIYDCPSIYTAPRKTSTDTSIQAPCLNILAAATPDALSDTIPEIAWSQGFTSRFIFIYGMQSKTYRNVFSKQKKQDVSLLRKYLREYFNELHGEFIWEEDAQDAITLWLNEEGMAPVPTYGRLSHYVGRRDIHVMKLSMVSAVAAGHGTIVTLSDFRRAQKWLFDAEATMPDVFRAMHQKSDQQLLKDAHYWMYTTWSTPKLEDRKPMSGQKIRRWFENKIPQDKIEGFIKTMESTGRIRKANGFDIDMWIPNTFDQFYDL